MLLLIIGSRRSPGISYKRRIARIFIQLFGFQYSEVDEAIDGFVRPIAGKTRPVFNCIHIYDGLGKQS